jgi:hypothetical protein
MIKEISLLIGPLISLAVAQPASRKTATNLARGHYNLCTSEAIARFRRSIPVAACGVATP